MTSRSGDDAGSSDAALAATLFAIDPVGAGGVVLRSGWGATRDAWLAGLRGMLPPDCPVRRVPANVTEDRLLGGLDLAATLQARRPVVERGLLAEADGGLVVVALAERLAPSTVAHLAATLDLGCVVVERDGIAARPAARVGVIALDEGMTPDEGVAAALRDRLAFHVDLATVGRNLDPTPDAAVIAKARRLFADTECDETIVVALCQAAGALGVESLRAPLLALRVARAHAALHGRQRASEEDAAIACRLVLAPRATRLPANESPSQQDDRHAEDREPQPRPADDESDRESPAMEQPLVDMVLAAARTALPAHILASLESSRNDRQPKSLPGKAGASSASARRGRPAGIRRGDPRGRARINVIETLRAAAPWQALRSRPSAASRVEIRHEDFRATRFKQHAATTTIFVVDASGSSAANRLAEAKGAVELLLADCYVRRDEVALISFRGRAAELILPPTRSLVRAKRCLAGLPGGGATPLAAAIDMAGLMAGSIARKGQSPVVVLLTDGKANMARDGKAGAGQAEQEAIAAARTFRTAGIRSLVVDTSPRPRPSAEQLARDMGARYLPLPYAGSRELSAAIQRSAAGSA